MRNKAIISLSLFVLIGIIMIWKIKLWFHPEGDKAIELVPLHFKALQTNQQDKQKFLDEYQKCRNIGYPIDKCKRSARSLMPNGQAKQELCCKYFIDYYNGGSHCRKHETKRLTYKKVENNKCYAWLLLDSQGRQCYSVNGLEFAALIGDKIRFWATSYYNCEDVIYNHIDPVLPEPNELAKQRLLNSGSRYHNCRNLGYSHQKCDKSVVE